MNHTVHIANATKAEFTGINTFSFTLETNSELGNIFLSAKECGNLIIPKVNPLIVPIIDITTNTTTILAPHGPNKLVAAKST